MNFWEATRGRKKEQVGFTLIEVLIVVVIIGVLAALVIPRFVAAPEKAMVAEANQMLGSLVRAQSSRIDTGTAFLPAAAPITSANWNSLGLTIPVSASKFLYGCSSPTCTASRTPTTLSVVTFSSLTNTWACSGNYTTMANGGCMLA